MASLPDWRALYPFESHGIDLDGHRYHYLDEGEGEPLLLVHGNPTWSFYWRNLVLALRERYRVVVVDHIGCGLSDKPARYPYTLEQHTRNLTQLVQTLDLQHATLLAHDWGGAIGLGAVLASPARFARIALFNTAAFPPSYIPLRIRACRAPVVGRVAVKGLNLFARAALTMAVEKPERMTPEVRAGLLAPYDTWSHRNAIYQFVRDIPGSRRHPTYNVLAHLEAGLPTLSDLPWMICWGMRDWCFREECLHRFEEMLPDASVHRFEDAGHYVIEDAYERILPLLEDFLAGDRLAERIEDCVAE